MAPMGRPPFPNERARLAQIHAVDALQEARAYLQQPIGEDEGHDLTRHVEDVDRALVALQETWPMLAALKWDEAVHDDIISRFRLVAEDVMTSLLVFTHLSDAGSSVATCQQELREIIAGS